MKPEPIYTEEEYKQVTDKNKELQQQLDDMKERNDKLALLVQEKIDWARECEDRATALEEECEDLTHQNTNLTNRVSELIKEQNNKE